MKHVGQLRIIKITARELEQLPVTDVCNVLSTIREDNKYVRLVVVPESEKQ